jgi:2-C-methyl-D-erythritol 4-phosphate cytidylyltransferase/2-C-methyl-D-erythritol 2,4-cyclodiphosphate synthase
MTQMHSKQPMSVGLVIVAAGRGERAGSPQDGPKQYRPIGGKAVIAHTLEKFMTWPQASQVVIVIHADDEALLRKAIDPISGADKVIVDAAAIGAGWPQGTSGKWYHPRVNPRCRSPLFR